MQLLITKNTGKPHIILYKRDDNSQTWMQADNFYVLHDLSHYAIEKALGYKTAFMSMLNKGMDIKDFENRETRKQIVIPEEASYAENMANLFLIEFNQGYFEDFNKVAQDAFAKMCTSYPAPELSETAIELIRNYIKSLIESWNRLPYSGTFVLTYEF